MKQYIEYIENLLHFKNLFHITKLSLETALLYNTILFFGNVLKHFIITLFILLFEYTEYLLLPGEVHNEKT